MIPEPMKPGPKLKAARSKATTRGRIRSLRLTTITVLLAVASVLSVLSQPGPQIVSMVISPQPEPAAMEPMGQVAALIGQLADDERQVAATQALLALGPAIESQLCGALQREPAAATFPFLQPQAAYSNRFILDPDLLGSHRTQYALEVLRSHLEEQRQLQTSRVTLHYRQAPLTNVLADFGRQIGAEVRAGSPNLGSLDWIRTNRVTVNFDSLNYWAALQQLERQANLSEVFENLNRPMLVQSGFGFEAPQSGGNRRSVVSGPLQITPVSVELARRLEYGRGSNSARVTLTLTAQAEPKFWNSGEHAMVQLDECRDDRGQSLLLDDAATFHSQGEGCYWNWTVPVAFQAPATGRHIQTLKGHFDVGLRVEQRYLTVTNLMQAQGQSMEFDGLRLTIKTIRDGIDGYAGTFTEMIIEGSAPTGSPFANQLTNPPDNFNVSVFDESRRLIPCLPRMVREDIWSEFRGESRPVSPTLGVSSLGESRQENGREVATLWLFVSKRVKPATLIWLTPSETRWLTVPFEMHGLKLPI